MQEANTTLCLTSDSEEVATEISKDQHRSEEYLWPGVLAFMVAGGCRSGVVFKVSSLNLGSPNLPSGSKL